MSATLSGDVREIVHELDADGQGYQTRAAASMLVNRYVTEGVCDGEGDPKPKVRALMRLGAGVAFKNYKSDGGAEAKKREMAAAWVGGVQSDFAEIDDDFNFEWLRVYAAWDEGEAAERKMLVRMTLFEVLDVIELKRKKAAEATAVANQLQKIVDEHPDWHDHPEMTVADILDIRE
jgi:hypothetical protein